MRSNLYILVVFTWFNMVSLAPPMMDSELVQDYFFSDGESKQINDALEQLGYSLLALEYDKLHAKEVAERIGPRQEEFDGIGLDIFLKLVELSKIPHGKLLFSGGDHWKPYFFNSSPRKRQTNGFHIQFQHHLDIEGEQAMAGDAAWFIPIDTRKYNYFNWPDGRYFLSLWYRDNPVAWTSIVPVSSTHLMSLDLHTINAFREIDEEWVFTHRPSILDHTDWQWAMLDAAKVVALHLGYEFYLLQSAANQPEASKKPDVPYRRFYDEQANRLGFKRAEGEDFITPLGRKEAQDWSESDNKCNQYLTMMRKFITIKN